jgi:Zn finger protein HypA/HybF involved in hydrogenase expression
MADPDTDAPAGWDDDALEMIREEAEKEQPDSVDPDQQTRQAEGWLRTYIECPNCQVPMSKIGTESTDGPTEPFLRRMSDTTHKFVCPECHDMMTHVEVKIVTASADDIEEVQRRLQEMLESLADSMASILPDS